MPAFRPLQLVLAALLLPGALSGQTVAPASRHGVITIAQSPHLLIRQVTKPTRAALSYAAFTGNPALQALTPGAEALTTLGEASLKKLAWSEESFDAAKAVDQLPASTPGQYFDEGLAGLAAFNYMKVNEYEFPDLLPQAMRTVLTEFWGGPALTTPSQRLSEFILVRAEPKGPVTGLWAKIDFEPWAKVDGTIKDDDGDGCPEFYLPLKVNLIPEDAYEELADTYQTEVLAGAEVDEYFEMVLGELYNKIYATIKPRGSLPVVNAAAVTEEYLKAELGTLEIRSPDVIVTAKPHGDWIYNVFVIGDKPGVFSGTPGDAPKPNSAAAAVPDAVPAASALPPFADPVQTVSLEDFQTDLRARLAALGPERVLQSPAKWLFLNRSLEVLTAPTLDGQSSDPFIAITDISTKLAAKGVALYFVPVPSKETVYPEKIGGRSPLPVEPNAVVAAFLSKLNAAGVKTIDLLPAFRKARAQNPDTLLYLAQDTHWTPQGLLIAAQVLAREAAQILPAGEAGAARNLDDILAVAPPFQSTEVTGSLKTDLTSMLSEADQLAVPATTFEAIQITGPADKPPVAYEPSSSPVLLMGDSYNVIFEKQHAQGAGLASHVAAHLGQTVELLAQQGGGPDVPRELAQRQAADPNYLTQKKVIFWVMTERDLLNYPGKWRKVPLK